jgi:hypothetical protein
MASNPSTATSGENEKLRAERKLRALTKQEAGTGVEFLPTGIFGFTYSPHTEGTPVFHLQTFQIFEVHKLGDGSVEYLGYMTEEHANALNAATRSVELNLYPSPYENAQRFVCVPDKRILRSKPASRENGNFMQFISTPKY